MINSYLQNTKEIDDHAVHLLFSANRWEQSAEMLSDLNNGVTLVIDRYAYSGAAFTGAKQVTKLHKKAKNTYEKESSSLCSVCIFLYNTTWCL